MKRKFGLLALLSLLLIAVSSGTTLAAEPVAFSAVGVFETLDAGIVSPAGESERYTVKLRTFGGTMVGPDLWGPFSITYGANLTTTQVGQLHATLTAGDYEATMRGETRMLAGPVLAVLSVDPLEVVIAANGAVRGTMTFTKGTEEGHASFDAGIWFQVSPEGGIAGVLPAGITLLNLDYSPYGISGPSQVSFTGQWHNHD